MDTQACFVAFRAGCLSKSTGFWNLIGILQSATLAHSQRVPRKERLSKTPKQLFSNRGHQRCRKFGACTSLQGFLTRCLAQRKTMKNCPSRNFFNGTMTNSGRDNPKFHCITSLAKQRVTNGKSSSMKTARITFSILYRER